VNIRHTTYKAITNPQSMLYMAAGNLKTINIASKHHELFLVTVSQLSKFMLRKFMAKAVMDR